jgi:hypothetical protein
VSTETDIELAERMINTIESYLNSGTPQPERIQQVQVQIEDLGNILDGIETLHTFKIDRLANHELAKVADLRRRWADAEARTRNRPGR